MLVYLLKFSVCLTIFLVFYVLFLEKEIFHHIKRYYLLSVLLISAYIPFISYTVYIDPVPAFSVFNELESTPLTDQALPINSAVASKNTMANTINYWPLILWSIYGIGVLIFGFKLIFNLYDIIHKIKQNPKQKKHYITNVLLNETITPHTFFRFIFYNKQKFEAQEIPQEVFWHEETHAKQKHSIDIVLIEVLQVILWFNPIIYFIKKAIKLNHEFLADQAVLNKGVSTTAYQEILLSFSASDKSPELVNAINYSSIKKRFTIMNTHTKKRSLILKSLLLLPILAIALYGFSSKVVVEKEANTPSSTLTINNDLGSITNGASEKLMQEYRLFIEEVNKTNIIDKNKYDRAKTIYLHVMSKEQRSAVAPLPKTILDDGFINLPKTKIKTPSEATFNRWKNNTNFALWFDGKAIDNSVLNNFTHTDIAYYTDSFIHKNARSEKFPQAHQVSLFTHQGFTKTYKEASINTYNKFSKRYSNKIAEFLKGNRLDHDELKILYYQGLDLYNKISKENRATYNIRPLAPVPAEKKVENSSTQQEKATPNQVKEYEMLVKKYSKSPEPKVGFTNKLKDMSRIKQLYDLMSSAQKKNVTPYPQSPPSLAIFITNDGKYLINDKEVSLSDIENIIQKFSANELNKTFVFTGKNDNRRYKEYYTPLRRSTNTKIRALDETYINLYSDENIDTTKNFHIALPKLKKGFRVVQHAFRNPKLKTYTIEVAKLIEQNGIKNIAY